MADPLTADDLLPLVKRLTLPERARLVRLIATNPGGDAAAYVTQPPKPDEFSTAEEPLAWDGDGWEAVGFDPANS